MSYQAPEWHPAFEEYSGAIYELTEDGVDVIQARIAERLEVSRPAVSEMVNRMTEEGLIDVDDDGVIALTDAGSELAHSVVRRHRLAERMLTDVLGLNWATAHHEAGKWEHVISPAVETAMLRLLDDPTTCPHGNPIPGSDYQLAAGSGTLDRLQVGDSFIVRRIPEALEWTEGLLEYLEQINVMPGRSGTITAASPDGTLTIEIDGQPAALSATTAQTIVVEPGKPT